MTNENWGRVEAAFEQVAALPVEERPDALDRLSGDDLELRREVESLLAADAEAGDFLAHPVMADSGLNMAGRRLGAWRIESKLGEGGMGTVYLAARADQEYEQRTALKVFSAAVHREDLRQRFRAERQILASLDHPGIARLLDGGTTEEGLPYLVMEHVAGLSIDRYCDERRLGIDERIDLILKVCAAVAHAHQNLVIHRDLKPSNILVTPAGEPRLLDFGIAKLVGPVSDATETAQRLMTPSFASPEQVAGRPITTASDVYALGVLLFRLLTGEPPYRFDPGRLGALEQAVLEQEPPRPSLVVQDRLRTRKLKGDLDNVVLMALAKDPRRRYASVELLMQDLRRYRQGLPVAARAATPGYRLRKLMARHRLAVGAGSVVAALIFILAVVSTVQAVHLARQRDELQRERDKAVEVTRFLQEMFRSPDPQQARGETITAREILDRSATRVQTELADQPETKAALLNTMGTAYHNLGLDDRARPLLEQALKLRRQHLGSAHPDVAESLDALGDFHVSRGELNAAEAAYRESLALRRRSAAKAAPALARTLNGLGSVLALAARYDAAEPLVREALRIDRAHSGNEQGETAETLSTLGFLRESQGDLAAAEALYREALGIFRRVYGEAYPSTTNLLNTLGVLMVKQGRFDAAEAFYRESLAAARKVYGDEHLEIAMRLNNLAFLYTDRGDYARAEAPGREAVTLLRKLLGSENPKLAIGLNNLAKILEGKGDLAAAQPLYEEAVRIERTTLGDKHPELARTLANLARLLSDRGDPKAGESLIRQALAIQRKALGEAHSEFGISIVILGSLRLTQGDAPGAEPLIRQGYQVLRKALSDDHWRTADTRSQLGECLAAQRQWAEAEPLLVAGYEGLVRAQGASGRATVAALKRLVAFYQVRGNTVKVALYRSRLPAGQPGVTR